MKNGPMKTGPMLVEQEIDADIQKNATDLFELDDKSRVILACVARGGPQTIYELQKHEGLSKPSIYRRLFGDGLLLKKNFLRLEGTVSFGRIKDIEKKYYGLDLKGFLASLSEVKCEENYMFQILLEACYDYYIHLKDITDWPGLEGWPVEERERFLAKSDEHWKDWANGQRDSHKENSRKRVKIDLAVFLSYHANQGLKLTSITNPLLYYLSFLRTYVTPSEFGPDMPVLRRATADIGDRSALFLEPWWGPFISCWLTWEISKQIISKEIRENLDMELMLALLIAYKEIIKELRNGNDPPWDYTMLYVGKPLLELKKNIPELSGE